MMRAFIFICCCLFCTALNAQSDAASIRKGNQAYQKGDYDIAEQYYNRAMGGKLAAQATFNIGDTQFQRQQHEPAAQSFAQSAQTLEQPTQRANAHYNEGNAWLKAQKIDESIAAYKNALRQNPNDVDAKYNLAYAQKLKKQQQNQENKDQNQENKDENQENKDQNQENKDQNQENQDENQENKDQNQQNQNENQENKDQNQKNDDKNQQNQDQKGNQQQNEQQQQEGKEGQQPPNGENEQNSPQDGNMMPGDQIKRLSKQEASRLLDAMRLEELKVQQRVRKNQAKGRTTPRGGKDW